MSDLVCIAFKDSSTADRVLNELRAMETEYVLDLEDAVIVVRDQDGKVHLKQCVDVFGGATKHGVALGVLWGGLMGLLFMNPLAGLLGSIAGGAGGGAMTTAASEYGLLSDYGIPDNFIKELGSTIKRGTSAIFLLIRSVDEDKVLPRIARYEGTILKTSLSKEHEETLRTALTHQRNPKAGAR
ncbi:MAG: membrane protein [Nitrospira sp.]